MMRGQGGGVVVGIVVVQMVVVMVWGFSSLIM